MALHRVLPAGPSQGSEPVAGGGARERGLLGVPDAPWDDDEEDCHPETIEELWSDEGVQVAGTHSILDMFTRATPEESDRPKRGTVVVTSEAEAESATGTNRPSRADLGRLADNLTEDRWIGRCAVLYEGDEPTEIVFWGISGD